MRIDGILIVSCYDSGWRASVVEIINNNVHREYRKEDNKAILLTGDGLRLSEDYDDFKLFEQIVHLVEDGGVSIDIQEKFPVFKDYTVIVSDDGMINVKFPRKKVSVPSEWMRKEVEDEDDESTPDAIDDDLPF